MAGDSGAAAGVSAPVAEVLGTFARAFLRFTGTGTRRRGMSHGRSGSTSTGTGRRGGPGRRLYRPTGMGRSRCLHAGAGIHTGACCGWCPPGVIT